MKIYIIGCTASGKSTLANILSKKMNIKSYELDLLVFDDANGHIRRTDEEIEKMFNEIIKKKSWIIEDVGRSRFIKGREQADKIYYIKLGKIRTYYQVLFRWVKQRLGILSYNYPPTIPGLIDMFKVTSSYFKKENKKLEELKRYSEKIEFIDYKKLNELEK